MKQSLVMVALVACLAVVPGRSEADPVHWSLGPQASPYTDAELLSGTHILPPGHPNIAGFSRHSDMASGRDMMFVHALEACNGNLSLCVPEGKLEAILLLTDQTTLIGHLTLDEYASLAEVTTVIEMYLTEDALTVRFFGGAWPGSLFSVFETSFPL